MFCTTAGRFIVHAGCDEHFNWEFSIGFQWITGGLIMSRWGNTAFATRNNAPKIDTDFFQNCQDTKAVEKAFNEIRDFMMGL